MAHQRTGKGTSIYWVHVFDTKGKQTNLMDLFPTTSDQDKEHQPGSMARTSSILSSASGNQSPRKSAPRSRSSSSKPTTHDNPTTKSDNCSDAMPTTSTAETPDSPSHQHSFLDTGLKNTLSSTNLDAQLQSLLQEKELVRQKGAVESHERLCSHCLLFFFFSYKLNIAKSR